MIVQAVRFGTETVQVTFINDAQATSPNALNVQRAACPRQIERLEQAAVSLLADALGVILPPPPDAPRLTARQSEVLLHLAAGETVLAISQRLFISQSTAKAHVQALYKALEVRTRIGVVVAAVNAGLIEPESAGLVRAGLIEPDSAVDEA